MTARARLPVYEETGAWTFPVAIAGGRRCHDQRCATILSPVRKLTGGCRRQPGVHRLPVKLWLFDSRRKSGGIFSGEYGWIVIVTPSDPLPADLAAAHHTLSQRLLEWQAASSCYWTETGSKGRAKLSSWPSGSIRWKKPSPHSASRGSVVGWYPAASARS